MLSRDRSEVTDLTSTNGQQIYPLRFCSYLEVQSTKSNEIVPQNTW